MKFKQTNRHQKNVSFSGRCREQRKRQVYSRAPLARAMRIHQLLHTGDYPNCQSIARELEVTAKTVNRDLEFMKTQLGWPVEYDAKRHGYFFAGPTSGFSNVPVNEKEVFSLLIARQAMAQYEGTPFQAPIEEVLRKLKAVLGQASADASEVCDFVSFRPFAPEKLDEVLFGSLTKAIKDCREIHFSYRKLGGTSAERRRVWPYHLACIENRWYLLAFDVNRKAIRTFVLSRIRDFILSNERFVVPKDFVPDEYMRTSFGAFKGEEDYEVVIDFDAFAADLIRGRQWHASQKITELPGGKIRFRMRLDSLEEAQRWVLGWGVHATVIRPGALCNRVHEVAAELAERYLRQLKEEAALPVPARHSAN